MSYKSSAFDRPIIILACPRSGSTLLFETLSKAKDLWTIGDESHAIIEHIPEFSTVYNGFISNELTEHHGDAQSIELLRNRFQQQLRNRDNSPYKGNRDGKIRFLEKTPKNSLRIRFLKKVFPDALYIHLIRDPKDNISSIIDGWQSKHFITYPSLPGFNGRWSYLLPPNWKKLQGKSIDQIASYQWQICNQTIVDELKNIENENYHIVHYDDFLDNSSQVIEKLCRFIGINFDKELSTYLESPLPYSKFTLSKPNKNKWLKNKLLLKNNMPDLQDTIEQLNLAMAPFTSYTITNELTV